MPIDCTIYPKTFKLISTIYIFFFLQETPEPSEPSPETGRMCNIMSTGTILLADIIPSLIIKTIAPFLPFYIK